MKGRLAGALIAGLALVVVLALPFAVRARFEGFSVPSESMEPTIVPGDHMLVDKRFRNATRGDLVVFRDPTGSGDLLVKRVVALGGESVTVRGRDVYVDCAPGAPGCRPLEEPYTRHDGRPARPAERAVYAVPTGSYFVMADNRSAGEDSRHWGPVAWDQVVGRPLVVYWSRDPATGAVRWARLGLRIHR